MLWLGSGTLLLGNSGLSVGCHVMVRDMSLFKQSVYHETYDVSSTVLRRHNEVSRAKPAYKSREGRYSHAMRYQVARVGHLGLDHDRASSYHQC
jgi:hypothetical protein